MAMQRNSQKHKKMAVSSAVLLYSLLSLANLFGLYKLARGVPFPEKWPWMITAGLVTLYVVLAAAYETGGSECAA